MGKNKHRNRTENGKSMRAVFRADSSINIGSGHLMRCLTLADNLDKKDADITFICRNLEGNLSHLVESKGYKLVLLKTPSPSNCVINPSDQYDQWLAVTQDYEIRDVITILSITDDNIDWLIVDHYSLDEKWETSMRPFVDNIMIIDDLANRKHDCDILLDQNLFDDCEKRYDSLVSDNCLLLCGPKYALLRNEFINARENMTENDGTVNQIFVFFGSSDQTDETLKAVKAIAMLNRSEIVVNVLIGSSYTQKQSLEKFIKKYEQFKLFGQVNNIAELMRKSDIAIGSGGTTTWERCCVGLSTLVITVAENQIPISNAAHKQGILHLLGKNSQVTSAMIGCVLSSFINNTESLVEMSNKAKETVDGLGVERVSLEMFEKRKFCEVS